ncbi:hypothetical protein [Massilia sp. CCM 8734]|uniref:hypothetical protein n=1 Tax=Massilia sp. CCM 8734 TaxID=2609283 RepID=UPI00141DB188|nr:hypothetical protein [Massilia sp. CCM 8734]NHZ94592.1 hypothetical protein [Massilia sp. CCM 8734]
MNHSSIHHQGKVLVREISHAFAQEHSGRDRKLIAWRLADLAKIKKAPGTRFQDLVNDELEARYALREVADSLIAKGHP